MGPRRAAPDADAPLEPQVETGAGTADTGASSAVRGIVVLAAIVVVVTLLCGGLVYWLAWQADGARALEQRQALRNAIAELQRIDGGGPTLTPERLGLIERTASLKGLRADVEADPAEGVRHVQPVSDRNGRIIAWLSWDAEHTATGLVSQSWPLLLLAVLGVAGLAVLCRRQLRWMQRRLAVMRLSHAEAAGDPHHDQLTGIPNQYHLKERLVRFLAERQETDIVAYAYLDIDGFSEINHSIGPRMADRILAAVAERIRRALPQDAVIGRIRGDCFAVILPAADSAAAVRTLGGVGRALAEPFRFTQTLNLTAGIGVAIAPDNGEDRDDIDRRAELALRAAKDRGRGTIAVFTREMEADLAQKHFIKRELAIALAERTLEINYQPIVAADGRGMVGVEALLRWSHPTRGQISPAEFVPAAEESGLMDALGQYVLRKALTDAARWPHLYVAVNVSPVQIRDRSFIDGLAALLDELRFDPSRLMLEVTEGVLIDKPQETKARLEELRILGVSLALDDFGSGYSSLSYLQKLPFDKLKIDRGFVTSLKRSDNAGVIIQAIVTLGRALNMTVLAEGVETEEQRVLLRLAGCNELQGFLFGRPVPADMIGAPSPLTDATARSAVLH